MTQITILGTSSMVPTKDRNVQAFYLEHKGEGILFDCGEGTQRQMNIAKLNRNKIKKILITHWHGDHVAGLIGLLQTVGHQLGVQEEEFEKEKSELHIYGPKGTKQHMHHLERSVIHEQGKINIKVHELEMKQQVFFENEDYELSCHTMHHGVACLGYSFRLKDKRKVDMLRAKELGLKPGREIGLLQRGETIEFEGKTIEPDMISTIEKGKKFVLIPDTRNCHQAVELAQDANLLIVEATFSKEHEEKAYQFKHLTSEQAASIAEQAGADLLVLTHFSQRYKDLNDHLEEARTLHNNTILAHDFMKLDL